MKSGLLSIGILWSVISFAQDNAKILGKWKVVSMNNDRMFLDLKADTIYLNKTLEEKLVDEKDFQLKKELTKTVLKQFFDSACYEFRKDMTYLEHEGVNGAKQGTYSMDTITSIIIINVPQNEKSLPENREVMKYSFQGPHLILVDSKMDNGANIKLEKQQ